MVKVKTSSEIEQAYSGSAGRASTNYRTEIGKVTDWQTQAASDAAEASFAEGIAEAVAAKSRQMALKGVSNAEWQDKAKTLGATRISTGITANAAKQAKNFEPSRAVIAGTTLLPKTRDASTNIDQRMKPLALALEAKRKELKGIR